MPSPKVHLAFGVFIGLILVAGHFATAGLFDDIPKPPANDHKTAATQPSATEPTAPAGEGAEEAYREAVHKAKADYLQTLIDIDQRFLSQLSDARAAALKAADDAEIQRIDDRSAAITARLKEHQADLASVRADGKPEIISARWGMGNHWADVTARVKELASAPNAVPANPDTLGIDPATGWRKKLQIIYVKDGQSHTVWIAEDEDIKVEDLIPAISGGV